MDVLDERDFAGFKFKITLGRIFNISVGSVSVSSLTGCTSHFCRTDRAVWTWTQIPSVLKFVVIGIRVKHTDRISILVSDILVGIGSDNGWYLFRHRVITWANADLLTVQTLGTNPSAMSIREQSFSYLGPWCQPKWKQGIPNTNDNGYLNIKCHINMCRRNNTQMKLSILVCQARQFYKVQLGVVSLTFHKLSKIISREYTMPEITFTVRISSWNFVRVPKAWFWAHIQSFSLDFS